MKSLRQFQEVNCRGCLYADAEKVGTGQACCTHPQVPRVENGRCLTRKQVRCPSVGIEYRRQR